MRTAVKMVAAAADVLRTPPPGVVVLAYHQVGGPRPAEVNLSPELFGAQLDLLVERADVCTLDDAVAGLDRATPAAGGPDRPRVVVTFDDGTADFVEMAVPALVERGLPVTLYLASGFVDDQRSFWDDGTVVSWAALRDAHATGLVAIECHTHDHVLLDRVDPAVARADLDRSIERIATEIGVAPRHLAYPKARAASPVVLPLVRARFRSAAVAGGRTNRPGLTDPFALARTPVQVSDGVGWFARKVAGGLALEGALRERLDDRRYVKASR